MPESPEIRLRLNGRHPTMSWEELTQAVHVLLAQSKDLAKQLSDLEAEVHSSLDERIDQSVRKNLGERWEWLERIVADATDLVQLQIKTGALDQGEANRVVGWRRHSQPMLRLGRFVLARLRVMP